MASRRLSTSLSDLLNSRLFEQVSTDQKCLQSICNTNLETHRQLWTSVRQSSFLCLVPDVVVLKSLLKTTGGAAMQQDSKC